MCVVKRSFLRSRLKRCYNYALFVYIAFCIASNIVVCPFARHVGEVTFFRNHEDVQTVRRGDAVFSSDAVLSEDIVKAEVSVSKEEVQL